MTFWIRWKGADGGEGPRLGPFDHRREAVHRIASDMDRFAADLEHGTGKAGSWSWDTARQVATLYRDDLLDDVAAKRCLIEQVVP